MNSNWFQPGSGRRLLTALLLAVSFAAPFVVASEAYILPEGRDYCAGETRWWILLITGCW
jgi:hypothetical protein